MPFFGSVVVAHPACVIAEEDRDASQVLAPPVTAVCQCGDGGGAAGFAGLESEYRSEGMRVGSRERAGYSWQTFPAQ